MAGATWHSLQEFLAFTEMISRLASTSLCFEGAGTGGDSKHATKPDLVLLHCRGKTVPTYAPSMDMGSYVVIVNAEKVTVSGNKFNDKMYRRHTGRPGSLKEETFKKLQAVSHPLLTTLCLLPRPS